MTMPPDPKNGESEAEGDRRYSPNTTYPRDIGEDGLPVRERKPAAEEGDGSRGDPGDAVTPRDR